MSTCCINCTTNRNKSVKWKVYSPNRSIWRVPIQGILLRRSWTSLISKSTISKTPCLCSEPSSRQKWKDSSKSFRTSPGAFLTKQVSLANTLAKLRMKNLMGTASSFKMRSICRQQIRNGTLRQSGKMEKSMGKQSATWTIKLSLNFQLEMDKNMDWK